MRRLLMLSALVVVTLSVLLVSGAAADRRPMLVDDGATVHSASTVDK